MSKYEPLLNYGYKVGKISLKGKTVDFEKV